jgi:hypothetical protein
MGPISGRAPRERRPLSDATLALIAVAFSELRDDVRRLLDSKWDEPVRRRAEELSSTLAQACQRQGLDDLVTFLRPAVNLTRLSKATAMPVLPALREKFDLLLRETQSRLSKRSTRFLG